ncbi:MAG: hypothetical protein H6662_20490 [Ardenticatenaceae bacterium]|nr:hypothetical protein [Ardenticatenaceae bacterium]
MVETDNSNPVAQLTRYELRHLVAHLEQSGRIGDLHRLLALETGEQRNAWYEAKDAVGDLQGYLDDVYTYPQKLDHVLSDISEGKSSTWRQK